MATDDRPRWRRRYAPITCAVIGGCLAYALCDWAAWPRLTVDPYTGTWSWPGGPTRTVPINYYGGLLWAAGGSALGAAIGVAANRWPRLDRTDARALTAAWALTSAALAAIYFVWTLWPF